MQKLKPCPFCGKNAKIYCLSIENERDTFSKLFKIKCEGCGVEFSKGFRVHAKIDNSGDSTFDAHERDLAIEAWNRRFSDGKEREEEA